jgi:hypothetical protein
VVTRAVVVVVSTRVVDIGALATDIVAVTRGTADIELSHNGFLIGVNRANDPFKRVFFRARALVPFL